MTEEEIEMLRSLGVHPIAVRAPSSYNPSRDFLKRDGWVKPTFARDWESWYELNYVSIFKPLVYGLVEYKMVVHIDADVIIRSVVRNNHVYFCPKHIQSILEPLSVVRPRSKDLYAMKSPASPSSLGSN